MSEQTDRIRDMVMALSQGDHDTAQQAASEVIAAKSARFTQELEEGMHNPVRRHHGIARRRNAAAGKNTKRGMDSMRGRVAVREDGDDDLNTFTEYYSDDDIRDLSKKYLNAFSEPQDAEEKAEEKLSNHMTSLGLTWDGPLANRFYSLFDEVLNDYNDDEDPTENEYDGQPSEYDEWQDYMGGDDWDQGQYDNDF